MAIHVPVSHSSLARFVPKGSRKPRTEVVNLVTTARLTEADPDDFRHVATLDYQHEIAEHAGRLWLKLEVWDRGLGRHVDATRDDLAAFLGNPGGGSPFGCQEAFVGTPVMARGKGQDGHRGAAPESLGETRQMDLGEAVTGARVQAFLDDRVRVAGGTAWIRPDMLACANWHSEDYSLSLFASDPPQAGFLGHPARPTAILDQYDMIAGRRSKEFKGTIRAFAKETRGIPFDLVPDDAHVAPTLSLYATMLREAVEGQIPKRQASGNARDALQAILDGNRDLWFDADTTMVGPDDAARLLAIHADFRANVAEDWHIRRGRLAVLAGYVREVVSQVAAREPVPEDVEALSAIMP